MCCLYSFLDEFLCVFVAFKNVPPKTSCFILGPARVIADGTEFWIVFPVKKLSLFCLPNIVCYCFKVALVASSTGPIVHFYLDYRSVSLKTRKSDKCSLALQYLQTATVHKNTIL